MSNSNHGQLIIKLACILVVCVSLISITQADESYSPNVHQAYPENVYFGDTHLHTNFSLDANGLGNKSLTPDEAYRFALGETISAHNGMEVRLKRPLDFIVVADHAENLGVMPRLEMADSHLLKTEIGKKWYQNLKKNPLKIEEIFNSKSTEQYDNAVASVSYKGPDGFFWVGFGADIYESVGHIGGDQFRRSVWREVGANAERYNRPGAFTAFVGYEWTSIGTGRDGFGNLHRVLIFKDGPDKTDQILPFSGLDSRIRKTSGNF